MLEKDEFNNLIRRAEEFGKENGKAKAFWFFSGNSPRSHYEEVAKMIRNGDSQLWLHYTNPLSGEFADELNVDKLFHELETNPFTLNDEEREEICLTYEQTHSYAWYEELERIVCNFLAD